MSRTQRTGQEHHKARHVESLRHIYRRLREQAEEAFDQCRLEAAKDADYMADKIAAAARRHGVNVEEGAE